MGRRIGQQASSAMGLGSTSMVRNGLLQRSVGARKGGKGSHINVCSVPGAEVEQCIALTVPRTHYGTNKSSPIGTTTAVVEPLSTGPQLASRFTRSLPPIPSATIATPTVDWATREGNDEWTRRHLFEFNTMRIFEGKSKRFWCDKEKSFCYLCQQPFLHGAASHCGNWEHACMVLFFKLCAQYKRQWCPREVLFGTWRLAPEQYRKSLLAGDELYCDEDDTYRRAELAAIIQFLVPFFALTSIGSGLAYQGERMFRADIVKLSLRLLPPISAEFTSMFQQKCWGRKNLELLYDSLNLGPLAVSLGGSEMEKKNDKGDVVRQLIAELHLVAHSASVMGQEELDWCHWNNFPLVAQSTSVIGTRNALSRASSSSTGSTSCRNRPPGEGAVVANGNTQQRPGPLPCYVPLLASIALSRLAAELVYLRSSHYVGRVRHIAAQYGFPSIHQLDEWGFN